MTSFRFHVSLGGLMLALMGWAVMSTSVCAQPVDPALRDPFLSDPEFGEPRDPLLPELPVERPLSPLEKRELSMALDRLAQEAERLYLLGRMDAAFMRWMREVRLRRIFGYDTELAAIRRVGQRAWQEGRTQEVQLLTLRLAQIQTALLGETPLNLPLLERVAANFEQLRDIDAAVAVYETLAVRAMQAGNQVQRVRFLERMANLQENWFRFEVAAQTYNRLLTLTRGENRSTPQRIRYLQRAAYNYREAGQPIRAIAFQQQLVQAYETQAQITAIPPLHLAIARNYRTAERLSQAVQFYQTAYTGALAQRQFNVASDAVRDLTEIYEALERPQDVQYLYDQQLAVERLSYNAYGIMEVFESLGQFYETRADLDAAIAAYEEALILARHLNHRSAYFHNRIQRLLLSQDKLTIDPAESHEASPPLGTLDPLDLWQENRLSSE